MLLKHRYQGGGAQDECVGSLYCSVWQLQFSCRACTQISLVQLGGSGFPFSSSLLPK